MNRKKASLCLVAAAMSFQTAVALAAAETTAAPKEPVEQEVQLLKARLAKLEAQLDKKEGEKKATAKQSVSFSGDSRIRWIDKHAANGDTATEQRVRLAMKMNVSKDVDFYGRFMALNNNEMGTTGVDDKVQFIDANFTHKGLLGTNSVTLGRFTQNFLAVNYWAATNGRIDGVKMNVGNKLNANIGFGDWGPASRTWNDDGSVKTTNLREAIWLDAKYPIDKNTKLSAMWLRETKGKTTDPDILDKVDFDVRGIGIDTKVADNLTLLADYTTNAAVDTQGTGYYAILRYRGADKAVPGSWGVRAEYRRADKYNLVPGITGVFNNVTDVRGPAVAAEYAPAKNVVIRGIQSFNSTTSSTGKSAPNYTRMEFLYSF